MGPPKVVALTLALMVAVAPLQSAAGRSHSQDVRACTFNVWRDLAPATEAAEIRKLGPSCDLMALQETGRDTAGQVTPPGWALVRPRAALELSTVYRPGVWTLGAHGSVLGPVSHLFPSATRRITWARLRARATGLVVTVINVHAIPHVDVAGHPRKLPRQALYRGWLITLGHLVRAQPGPVLVLGDFNVDVRADCRVRFYWFPCAWGDRVGLVNVWRVLGYGRGTHGRRTIDYALDRGPRISPRSRHVLFGYPSDHRPVVTRYRLTR